MNNKTSRRRFLQLSGSVLSAASLGMWPLNLIAGNSGKPTTYRVVIVGGGFGGATCAKYIKLFDPSIDVTLVERDVRFVTCPFSNLVIGGLRDINSITHDYSVLKKKYGINVVQGDVVDIDAVKNTLLLKNGKSLPYDKAVVSPGIDFLWNSVEGYTEKDVDILPHAWKAGKQTIVLKSQIEAMPDGGVVVIVAPPNPFRCPPGPYERASLIAGYLKQYKPKSKVVILDAKQKFSKMPLFTQAWDTLYPGMIEWVAGTSGGRVTEIDVAKKTVFNELGDPIAGAVVNYIPHQAAGAIARKADLTDASGWCPVNQKTFESTKHKNIHVIGDSAVATPLPKSGYAANSEGKMCAAAIVSELNAAVMPDPSYSNTCYSLIGKNYGISVAAVYRYDGNKIIKVKGSGGISPIKADDSFRRAEALYTSSWYANITRDTFS
ncbi:MAG: FAD-dependent oxidoreductase [Gammaproteobacteria bacterium]|nr:FAD-dependent oxidoreductase [Gammaproteobacteria bacterium]